VRTLIKIVFMVAVSAALVGAPAMAAPASPASVPLGVVLQANRAQIGTDMTSGGATIYDGDILQTGGNGTLRARLGTSQMYLRENSAAQVTGLSNGFTANLTAGTVVVSSAQGQTFQLFANGATIRPVGTDDTVAQITRVSPSELVLSSTRGVLKVSMGEEVRTVEAGKAYRMKLEPDASDPGPQGGPYHTARNRFLWIAVFGISAGTGIGIWRALISPSQP
jgi:hypothetical protein